jgi:solute carrier family 13 (sodium-dependent dicarboxylate transporter), member 2/3/5
MPHARLRRRLARIPGRRLARQLDLDFKRLAIFTSTLLVAGMTMYALMAAGIPRESAFMAGIFVLAGILWVMETLPLFATAIVVIALQIVLLANPGAWPGFGFEEGPSPDFRAFLQPVADPVIILFFGGFLLARAAAKFDIDQALAAVILRLFGSQPAAIMFGLMLVTAVFSMWMSNTATTAMMITLVVPMLRQIPPGRHIRKGLVLCIPFAANIGGMGTPIASPPNAVAMGFLQSAGYEVSFLQWMLIAVPLMLALLAICWMMLRIIFPSESKDLHIRPVAATIDAKGWFVALVFLITIGLWVSEGWHRLPAAITALFPAVAFTATGLLNREDVNSLEWNILILIAGGIALGSGMQMTGLDEIIVGWLPLTGGLVLPLMVIAAVVLSTFMSNTATANLLLPIGISLAAISPGTGAVELGVSIALVASVSMALPVSTPPNAIAYAQGDVSTRDFALVGGMVGVLATVLVVLFGEFIISFWIG